MSAADYRSGGGGRTSVAVRLGYWLWGCVLAAALAFIGYVLVPAAMCIGASRATVALGRCEQWRQRWYLVLRDWQTGIGVVLGLLGIAWATFFRSATS